MARHDADNAREEAGLVRAADAATSVPAFIDARLLFDAGSYDEALPLFVEAVNRSKRAHRPLLADLRFYTAETLARLDRTEEAEAEYVEELIVFPENARASAALAVLYQAAGRSDDASRVVSEMVETTPTPEIYALAARLWTTIGNAREAAAARAEARKESK